MTRRPTNHVRWRNERFISAGVAAQLAVHTDGILLGEAVVFGTAVATLKRNERWRLLMELRRMEPKRRAFEIRAIVAGFKVEPLSGMGY